MHWGLPRALCARQTAKAVCAAPIIGAFPSQTGCVCARHRGSQASAAHSAMASTRRNSSVPAAKKATRKRAAPARVSGTPERSTARRRSPEEVQARILNAAVAEFAEHSYSGARVDRISKNAHTVDRMIYYYYGSKERLYQRVLEHAYEELIEEQRRLPPTDDDPIAGIRQLVAQSCEHYRSRPEFVRLVMTENLLRAQHLQKSERLRGTLMPLVERITHLVALGKKKKIFRADAQPQHVLMSVMALGYFYVSNQYTTSLWLEDDLMQEQRYRQWVQYVGDVICNYLTTKPR